MSHAATTVYAVRHGQTEWNVMGRKQGHMDSPLTALGVQQAHEVAELLVGKGIKQIHSSDLGRAMQTAKIIGHRLGLEIHPEQGLRERAMGVLQGLTDAECAKQYPGIDTAFPANDPDSLCPDGESTRQQHERVVTCLDRIVAGSFGQTVLIVGHWGVLVSIVRLAHHIPLDQPYRRQFSNAKPYRFIHGANGWRMGN